MIDPFIHFLDQSPSVYHAAKEVKVRFLENDFTPLSESDPWDLKMGESYVVTRDDALIAAFRMPKKKLEATTILATHLDSPALKVKPKPEVFHSSISMLSVEAYGSPILSTWIDRDLVLAGRIIVENENKELESKLVYLDDYPLIIPSLAIHLNKKKQDLSVQNHMRAICSIDGKEKSLKKWLLKHHSFHELISFDLFLIPQEKASLIGFENELISSYRLDNLSSVFAATEALIHAAPREECLQLACFWDHEEIGSKTYRGANSSFLQDLFQKIFSKQKSQDLFPFKSRSLCLSCDAAHALHPNFIDQYDKENAPEIGKGPAIKYSPKYATTAASAAPIIQLAKNHKIPLQTFASHSDIGSGSTVGAMMGANIGIATVDLGAPIWSMHSIRETMAVEDQKLTEHLLTKALEEPFTPLEEGL